jgi:hypothetical protein
MEAPQPRAGWRNDATAASLSGAMAAHYHDGGIILGRTNMLSAELEFVSIQISRNLLSHVIPIAAGAMPGRKLDSSQPALAVVVVRCC